MSPIDIPYGAPIPLERAMAAIAATAAEARKHDWKLGSRGGIPLVESGKLVGAIGCSGGTGSQDEVACRAGVAAIIK